MSININERSIFYAIGLQFCCPGLGRLYLKDWRTGISQLIAGPIIAMFFVSELKNISEDWKTEYFLVFFNLGTIWSWIDGYLMAIRPLKIEEKKITLVYHNVDFHLKNRNRSSITASVLQLFGFGLGRIYMGSWVVGLFQLGGLILVSVLRYQVSRLHISVHYLDVFSTCSTRVALFGAMLAMRIGILGYSLFDSYSILKTYEASFHPKDRSIAGMLQLKWPGLGRCYLGYWSIGVLQFLTSFIFIGVIWSWLDGHHILLDPRFDKDGNRRSLTGSYQV